MRMLKAIVTLCLIAVCSFVHAADYYVDAGAGPGEHSGTMDDPFATIGDAMAIAVYGDTVHVAAGVYTECITIPDGVAMLGGYTQDWLDRDPWTWPSIVDGERDPHGSVIVAAGELILDGLTIRNGGRGVSGSFANNSLVKDCHIHDIWGMDGASGPAGTWGWNAHGIFLRGEQVEITGCRIDLVKGGDGGDASESGQTAGTGGTGYGIHVVSGSFTVEGNTVTRILGGNGGNGTNDMCHGAEGGHAVAVLAAFGDADREEQQIVDNLISDVTAGSGGNGGVTWEHAGNSAGGGDAWGVMCEGTRSGARVEGNHISHVGGGNGGASPWAHLTPGLAGDGGDAGGIWLEDLSDSIIKDNYVVTVTGAQGGAGGVSGDYPGSGSSTDGGNGGAASGIYILSGNGNVIINNLIDTVFGGDGNSGGAPWMVTVCSDGGTGGMAAGICIESGVQGVQFNTINSVIGGSGGDGGMSSWRSRRPVKQPGLITPTPTPTGGPGPVCCGQGGDGGLAVGLRIPDSSDTQQMEYNIVMTVIGGPEGECFSPVTGNGLGMEKLGGTPVMIDYNNVYECSTSNYRNLTPGPSSLNADPLFVTGDMGDHYLSSLDAGQEHDSPCMDASDLMADSVFDPEWYTNRTDHEPDSGLADLGFHYRLPGETTPVPTATPEITPTATGTPDISPTPTDTPLITPTPTESPVITPTPTDTPDMSPTPTDTPEATASPTVTPDITPTPTSTPDTSPTPTHTPDTSPSPTGTPDVTPTPTQPSEPSATPTPEHDVTVVLEMPLEHYVPGNTCYCRVTVTNHVQDLVDYYLLFVILDISNSYFFAPSFSEFDYFSRTFPPGETTVEIIPEFSWPPGCGSLSDARFYAAFTDTGITQIVSNLAVFTFGWSSDAAGSRETRRGL